MARRDLPVRAFKTAKAWETWLSRHDDVAGLWVRLAKRSSSRQSLTYREAVEGALCYGWIDGQGKRYDDESCLVKFTPRKPNSIWSKINRARASELVATGRMRPSGLAAIERAKQNGRLGRGVRFAPHGGPAPGSHRRVEAERHSHGVLQDSEQPEPVRDPVQDPDGQTAGDASRADRTVRPDARAAPDAVPDVKAGSSMSGAAARRSLSARPCRGPTRPSR